LVICPSGIDFARIAPTSRVDRDVPRRPMADIGWKYRGVRVGPTDIAIIYERSQAK
jgi:hypothetical protein